MPAPAEDGTRTPALPEHDGDAMVKVARHVSESPHAHHRTPVLSATSTEGWWQDERILHGLAGSPYSVAEARAFVTACLRSNLHTFVPDEVVERAE